MGADVPNRRDFLRSAIAAVGMLAVDPEELLWRPTKTIFIPPPRKLVFYDIVGPTYTNPHAETWVWTHMSAMKERRV